MLLFARISDHASFQLGRELGDLSDNQKIDSRSLPVQQKSFQRSKDRSIDRSIDPRAARVPPIYGSDDRLGRLDGILPPAPTQIEGSSALRALGLTIAHFVRHT